MVIVANMYVLKLLSKIDIFKMDLGKNLTGPYSEEKHNVNSEFKFDIRDSFVSNYKTSTGRLVHKFGNIGILVFYNDPSLTRDELLVFNEKKIYNPDIDLIKLRDNTREYFSTLLQELNTTDVETESEEVEMEKDVIKDVIKVKNGKELNKDEFIQAIINQRKNLKTE